jgi:predicted phosphodiesterase
VIYVPGNHDEMFRQFTGMNFGGVEIKRQAIHTTADGRRLLVVHGDEFDAIMLSHRWLAFLGDQAYGALMRCNHVVNKVRGWMGKPYWSLSKTAKKKVKNAVEFISRFEHAVAHEAAARGVDGVVCGHIHHAEFVLRFGLILFGRQQEPLDPSGVVLRNALAEGIHFAKERLRLAVAFVGDDAAHGDHFMHATSGARQKHALEDLDALLVTFDDLVVDIDRVADGKPREFARGLELRSGDAVDDLGAVACHM